MAQNDTSGYVLLVGPDGYYQAISSRRNGGGSGIVYRNYLEADAKAYKLNREIAAALLARGCKIKVFWKLRFWSDRQEAEQRLIWLREEQL